jgi:hypothetical protein
VVEIVTGGYGANLDQVVMNRLNPQWCPHSLR